MEEDNVVFPWIAFLTYITVTAVTPGPNNILSLSNASRVGFRRALPLNLGMWVGFTIITLLSAVFCSFLSAWLPAIELPMKIVGALYMLWLAFRTAFPKQHGTEVSEPVKNSFTTGLVLQFLNPKTILYAIISMEAYILPHYAGDTLALALFAVLLSTVGFSFSLLWAAFGSAFRVLFTRHAKITNAVMALALVYCAVALFV